MCDTLAHCYSVLNKLLTSLGFHLARIVKYYLQGGIIVIEYTFHVYKLIAHSSSTCIAFGLAIFK